MASAQHRWRSRAARACLPADADVRAIPPQRHALVCEAPGMADAGPAAGDWLSGRAPRSHRGGQWFDPTIAHTVSAALRLTNGPGGSGLPFRRWPGPSAGLACRRSPRPGGSGSDGGLAVVTRRDRAEIVGAYLGAKPVKVAVGDRV